MPTDDTGTETDSVPTAYITAIIIVLLVCSTTKLRMVCPSSSIFTTNRGIIKGFLPTSPKSHTSNHLRSYAIVTKNLPPGTRCISSWIPPVFQFNSARVVETGWREDWVDRSVDASIPAEAPILCFLTRFLHRCGPKQHFRNSSRDISSKGYVDSNNPYSEQIWRRALNQIDLLRVSARSPAEAYG